MLFNANLVQCLVLSPRTSIEIRRKQHRTKVRFQKECKYLLRRLGVQPTMAFVFADLAETSAAVRQGQSPYLVLKKIVQIYLYAPKERERLLITY
jgi:hypothetical protein